MPLDPGLLARVEASTQVPDWLAEQMRANFDNGCVGQRLVSETERCRVWTINLKPGERLPLHKHVKDYFWVALTGGRARSWVSDGKSLRCDEFELEAGATKYNRYAADLFKLHDLENIGDTELIFVTVEFNDSANPYLPVPNDRRGAGSDGLISSQQIA